MTIVPAAGRFSPRRARGVSKDQNGFGQCITNAEAMQECPRRTSCEMCGGGLQLRLVRHKVRRWHADGVRDCKAVALEPLSCSASLSKLWLYMLLLGLVVVIVFGIVLFRTLPVVQSFRAISVLVALVGGALFGMLISFMTSVSLVEITETPFFSITFGAFFLLEAYLIGNHVYGTEFPERGYDKHVIMLLIATFWMFISGCSASLSRKDTFTFWVPGQRSPFILLSGLQLWPRNVALRHI